MPPRVICEETGYPVGIFNVLFHAKAQSLQAEQKEKRVERRWRRTDVAEQFDPGTHQVAVLSEILPELKVVIGGGRLGEHRKVPVVVWECSRLHDHSADRHTVATDELGGRVDDNVGTVLDGPTQVGGSECVVDNQWDPMFVGHFGVSPDIENVTARVADCLPEYQLGLVRDRRLNIVGVGHVDECHIPQ